MKLVSTLLCLSLLIFTFIEAVALHRATVCRQKAWLRSTELLTASTLNSAASSQSSLDVACQISVNIEGRSVSWRKARTLKKNAFEVDLKGYL